MGQISDVRCTPTPYERFFLSYAPVARSWLAKYMLTFGSQSRWVIIINESGVWEEQRAGVIEIGLSGEWIFCQSCSGNRCIRPKFDLYYISAVYVQYINTWVVGLFILVHEILTRTLTTKLTKYKWSNRKILCGYHVLRNIPPTFAHKNITYNIITATLGQSKSNQHTQNYTSC